MATRKIEVTPPTMRAMEPDPRPPLVIPAKKAAALLGMLGDLWKATQVLGDDLYAIECRVRELWEDQQETLARPVVRPLRRAGERRGR